MLSFAASIQVSTNAGHGSEYAELAAEMIWPKPSNILLRIMHIAKLHTCAARAQQLLPPLSHQAAHARAHMYCFGISFCHLNTSSADRKRQKITTPMYVHATPTDAGQGMQELRAR